MEAPATEAPVTEAPAPVTEVPTTEAPAVVEMEHNTGTAEVAADDEKLKLCDHDNLYEVDDKAYLKTFLEWRRCRSCNKYIQNIKMKNWRVYHCIQADKSSLANKDTYLCNCIYCGVCYVKEMTKQTPKRRRRK